MAKVKKVYENMDLLPIGRTSEKITAGCLCLEGGAWKGLYTVGVLDALMEEDISFHTNVGVSAGAMSLLGYLSGQIGWSIRTDLGFRHDPKYCGFSVAPKEHSVTGFQYLYKEICQKKHPLDIERFRQSPMRLVAVACNMFTGESEYFEKGKCNITKAISASAMVPYVSRPVVMNGIPYLDGGCSDKIPYDWAKNCSGERKIVVVKTREREYRRSEEPKKAAKIFYRKYPNFVRALNNTNRKFNQMTEDLLEDEKAGKIFLLAPSKPVTVTRFDPDLEKLADLYFLGYRDMKNRMDELKDYLRN